MSLKNTVARMLAKDGANYTLRTKTIAAGPNAYTIGAITTVDQTVRGRERGFTESDMHGAIPEGTSMVVIDAATVLGAAPNDGDEIVMQGNTDFRQITTVDKRYEAGVIRKYVLIVKR